VEWQEKIGEQPKVKAFKIYDKFIKKGKTGDGKTYFTKEHIAILDLVEFWVFCI